MKPKSQSNKTLQASKFPEFQGSHVVSSGSKNRFLGLPAWSKPPNSQWATHPFPARSPAAQWLNFSRQRFADLVYVLYYVYTAHKYIFHFLSNYIDIYTVTDIYLFVVHGPRQANADTSLFVSSCKPSRLLTIFLAS